MTMTNALQELVGKTFDNQRIQAFFFAEIVHKLFQIVIEILKNEDKFFIGVDNLT